MSWRDAVALAVTSVRRQLGRAILTVAAVALAAALLTALLTIAGTAKTRVLDQLAKGGPLSGIKVAAAEASPGDVDEDDPDPGKAKILDEAARREIAALAEVRSVLPVVTSSVYIIAPDSDRAGRPVPPFVDTAVGLDLSQPARLPVSITAGRLPTPTSSTEVAVTQSWLERFDIDRTEAATVLGTEIEAGAGRLDDSGPGRPAIRGRWVRLEIVGVVAQEAASGSLLVPLAQAQAGRTWTASGPDGGRTVGLSPSPYSGLLVVADGLDAIPRVRNRISTVGYSTSAPENLIASVRRYLRVVEIVLSAVGAIALAVAGLGITNALLAAVRERRREIGVLKAIGARDRDVLRIFLVEATVLGLLGGVVGAVLGDVAARGVGAVVNGYLRSQGLPGVEPEVSLVIPLAVTVAATLLALIGGTLPALRAAHLPAREAVGGS